MGGIMDPMVFDTAVLGWMIKGLCALTVFYCLYALIQVVKGDNHE